MSFSNKTLLPFVINSGPMVLPSLHVLGPQNPQVKGLVAMEWVEKERRHNDILTWWPNNTSRPRRASSMDSRRLIKTSGAEAMLTNGWNDAILMRMSTLGSSPEDDHGTCVRYRAMPKLKSSCVLTL